MRAKFLRSVLLVSAVIMGSWGMLSPREASAALGVCNYYCLDPELTCCITCYRMGGSCVCPDFCTID
jgi:hypothetical protein